MSYDQRQVIDAVLVTCATCLRQFYMTHPKPICVACRQEPQK